MFWKVNQNRHDYFCQLELTASTHIKIYNIYRSKSCSKAWPFSLHRKFCSSLINCKYVVQINGSGISTTHDNLCLLLIYTSFCNQLPYLNYTLMRIFVLRLNINCSKPVSRGNYTSTDYLFSADKFFCSEFM